VPTEDERAAFGLALARGMALLVLGQIRTIEETIDDPARRWEILRTGLERFSHQEKRSTRP
jgi:hypothetical protein